MRTFDIALPSGSRPYVGGLAVAPAGNALAVWGGFGGVLVPDLSRPADQVWLGEHGQAAFAGGRLVVAAGDRLAVRDAADGREVDALRPAAGQSVWRVAAPRDGGAVAASVAGGAGHIARWDPAAKAELPPIKAPPRVMPALSPDGRVLAAVSPTSKVVRTWVLKAARHPKRATAVAKLPGGYARAVAVAPDGSAVAACARKAVVGFDPATGARVFAASNPGRSVKDLAFDPTGRRLLTADGSDAIAVWDLPDPRPIADPTPKCKLVRKLNWQIGPVRAVAFAADGTVAAGAGDCGQVVVWDVG